MTRQEFLQKIDDWVSKDKDKWNHITLMAYFYKKYFQKNGVHFIPASWNGEPAKTKESRDFSKLFKKFAPEDYDKLSGEAKGEAKLFVVMKVYHYISWPFDWKCRAGDRSVNGTQFFLVPSLINEFERAYTKHLSKNASKSKFDILIDWCKKENPEILDSHQLEKPEHIKMIIRYAEMYKLEQTSPELKTITKAKELGLV